MVYIVTEDTGSGATFWKSVISTYLTPNEQKKVVFSHASGNRDIVNKCKEINLTKMDILIIMMDNIGTNAVVPIYYYALELIEQGYNCFISEYYSLEHVFLCYTNLEKVCNFEDEEVLSFIDDIRQCSIKGMNWREYKLDVSIILRYMRSKIMIEKYPSIGLSSKILNTREQCESLLLSYITNNAQRSTKKINKSTLGVCWIESCENIQNTRVGAGYCKGCCWDGCSMTDKNKLDDLGKNSIPLSVGISNFGTLIDTIKKS